MANAELALAAIGTGGIYKAHRKNLEAIGGNKVVAVCDVDQANLKEAAAAHGARAYTDFNELFDKEQSLDAVLLCTPPTVRFDVIAGAAERKLPVFTEKPPARTLDDARRIIETIEKSGIICSVGFMYRYAPAVDRLKSLIGGETINLVQSAFLCSPALTRKIPGWFFIKEKSGGHVVDQAIHVIDLIRFIAGDITEVHTLGNNVICKKEPDFTVEDSSSTNMRFESGASGCHIHSWAYRRFVAELTVTGAEYRLTLKIVNAVSGLKGDRQIDESFDPSPTGDGHYWEMAAFLEAVRTGDASGIRSTFADASKTLATVLAMNKSIETGRPEPVSL